MSFNWNVYKVFKNGKRAKAPVHNFYYEGDIEEVYEYFSNSEIKLLGPKATESKFHILNDSVEQEWVDTTQEALQRVAFDRVKRVLAPLIRELDLSEKNVSVALLFCRESNWKWQWSAVQTATHKYLAGLSDKFDTYEEAQDWIKSQIVSE